MEAIRPGHIIVDMGTGSPKVIREIRKALAEKQSTILDAPVSGGLGKATTGELSIMVSGDKAAFDKCHEVFKILGKEIFHISEEVGTGHTVKIINNLLYGINLAAVSEAMVLAVKAGLDPEMFVNIVNASTGECWASRVKVPGNILKRNFANGFQAKLQHKDMDLATTLAKELNVALSLGNLAKEYYMAAMAAGRGEMDNSVIVTLLEDLTKVTVEPVKRAKSN
jgi:3-hydroxyisobutyrate dehydrogenase-like beta-hydroxyacid dehydrogenase